jgi:hypothetical protein
VKRFMPDFSRLALLRQFYYNPVEVWHKFIAQVANPFDFLYPTSPSLFYLVIVFFLQTPSVFILYQPKFVDTNFCDTYILLFRYVDRIAPPRVKSVER